MNLAKPNRISHLAGTLPSAARLLQPISIRVLGNAISGRLAENLHKGLWGLAQVHKNTLSFKENDLPLVDLEFTRVQGRLTVKLDLSPSLLKHPPIAKKMVSFTLLKLGEEPAARKFKLEFLSPLAGEALLDLEAKRMLSVMSAEETHLPPESDILSDYFDYAAGLHDIFRLSVFHARQRENLSNIDETMAAVKASSLSGGKHTGQAIYEAIRRLISLGPLYVMTVELGGRKS